MTAEVIGYTKAELIETMLAAGIHTSVDKFRELAIELQRRALAAYPDLDEFEENHGSAN